MSRSAESRRRARVLLTTLLGLAVAAVLPALATAGSSALVAPEGPLAGVVPLSLDVPAASGPVTFEWSSDDGATWRLIALDADGSDGFSARWDSAGVTGPVVLRGVAASGEKGRLRVAVDNRAPGLQLRTRVASFSPNGDGRRDTAPFTVISDEPGSLTVVVKRPGGRVVEELLADEPVDAGRRPVVWDGERPNKPGRPVASGLYVVEATITDAAGNAMTRQREVVVDTKAPGLSWRMMRPTITSKGPLKLRFRTADPDGALVVTIRLVDQYGNGVRQLLRDRTTPGRVTMRLNADLGRVMPGGYLVEVEARDLAGNVTTRSKPLRIDGKTRSKVIRRLPGAGRRVALSFDDCNETAAWSRILTILDQYDAKASFFCLGNLLSSRTSVARRTVADGHTIGAHLWDHKSAPAVGYAGTLQRLNQGRDRWWALSRIAPTPFWRPPFGHYDATTLAAAGDAGYRWTVMWDVDPSDYLRPAPSVTASRVLSAVRPGSIVVLHAVANTASALPTIIEGLRARNLEPVSLHTMFQAAGLGAPRR